MNAVVAASDETDRYKKNELDEPATTHCINVAELGKPINAMGP